MSLIVHDDLNLCYETTGFSDLPITEQLRRLKRDLRNRSVYLREMTERNMALKAESEAKLREFKKVLKASKNHASILKKDLKRIARGY